MTTDFDLASQMIRCHAHGREITDPAVHKEMAGTCGGAIDGMIWEAKKDGLHLLRYETGDRRIIRWDSLAQPDLFEGL
ncbi:hypothetical protein [Brevibacterium antiquum]|uniref:Uncharacterized protein n=1 Tax=Brevibacterium antiquum TaxID=234835 RepID=A0A2H1IMY8_9MICO|nr:hypothetical protein [Brevibacterium antiquum]SMX76533.1 hypothetical protein BANT10_01104 [Brevibacterium antiquum]